jgi:hypothetical protein
MSWKLIVSALIHSTINRCKTTLDHYLKARNWVRITQPGHTILDQRVDLDSYRVVSHTFFRPWRCNCLLRNSQAVEITRSWKRDASSEKTHARYIRHMYNVAVPILKEGKTWHELCSWVPQRPRDSLSECEAPITSKGDLSFCFSGLVG